MNRGIKIEYELVNVFNNKKYGELNEFHQSIVKRIFPNIIESVLISSGICNRYSKPDIYIEVSNVRKYISVKSGRSDSMHFESIKDFIIFLRKFGISIQTQKTILFFHYGDGTLDGTGNKRIGVEELISNYYHHIKLANYELNNKNILLDCLDRFVFKGNEYRKVFADYIYFGNKTSGVICSKEEIIKFVLSRKYDHIRTLHIGPMTIQPYLRDIKRISKNLYKRNMIQVKWSYLLSDMQRIDSKRI